MDYSGIVAVIIALIFGYLYIHEGKTEGKEKPSTFNRVFKDIWLMLCITFIVVALNTVTIPVTQICITPHINLTTVPVCDEWNTTYALSPALQGASNGFGYAYYAIIIVFLAKIVWDVWDSFNSR